MYLYFKFLKAFFNSDDIGMKVLELHIYVLEANIATQLAVSDVNTDFFKCIQTFEIKMLLKSYVAHLWIISIC